MKVESITLMDYQPHCNNASWTDTEAEVFSLALQSSLSGIDYESDEEARDDIHSILVETAEQLNYHNSHLSNINPN